MKPKYSILGLGVTVCLLLVASSICVLLICTHISKTGAASVVCLPGFSLRCEPDDCGRLYVRCGRNQKRQEVPADRVCYKGALLSIKSQLLPPKCLQRTSYARNTTTATAKAFDLQSCNCPLVCSGTAKCVCYCKSGKASTSICANNGRTYANPYQARCCLPSCRLTAGAELDVSSSWVWSWAEAAFDFGRLVISSSLQEVCDSVRDAFTFPPTTIEEDACCTRLPDKCNQC